MIFFLIKNLDNMKTINYNIKVNGPGGLEGEFRLLIDPDSPKIPHVIFEKGNLISIVTTQII